MIGWILRHVREYKCEHEWSEPHNISVYGDPFRRPDDIVDTRLPTTIKKVYICSKCLAKRTIRL